MKHPKQQHGFTLMELMITVAIVGILAAVALPSYREYVRRGQVPEGITALSSYRLKMEQFYQDNRSYGTGACAAGGNAPSWNDFQPRDAQYFTYACELTNAGQGYKITATGSKGSAVGNSFTIDSDNARTTPTFKGSSSGKDCWLVRGDEC
jgi:type IV pilus assembly protein PilE